MIDFGISILKDGPRLTRGQQEIFGTPGYIAPEYLSGNKPTEQTDIFSLGAVAYEMLAGESAFSQTDFSSTLRQEPPILRGVPQQLALLVKQCLEKDPSRRLASARVFLDTLESLRADLTTEQPSPATGDESFLSFEQEAVWQRYQQLISRQDRNFQRLVAAFISLVAFALTLFAVERWLDDSTIRLWSFAGVYMAIGCLVLADRDLRSYGRSLMEKVYCLSQLAIIRDVRTKQLVEYRERSLLPIGALKPAFEVAEFRPGRLRQGFPERISPSQIKNLSYYFKSATLLPAVIAVLFLGELFWPRAAGYVADNSTFNYQVRLIVGFSFVIFAWALTGASRCSNLQKYAFAARRINPSRWPEFPTEEVRRELWHRPMVVRIGLPIIAILSAGNLVRFIWVMADPDLGLWETMDWVLGGVTMFFLLSTLLAHEFDVRSFVKTAQSLYPLGSKLSKSQQGSSE